MATGSWDSTVKVCKSPSSFYMYMHRHKLKAPMCNVEAYVRAIRNGRTSNSIFADTAVLRHVSVKVSVSHAKLGELG